MFEFPRGQVTKMRGGLCTAAKRSAELYAQSFAKPMLCPSVNSPRGWQWHSPETRVSSSHVFSLAQIANKLSRHIASIERKSLLSY